jgi:regulator of protease activity HflC (stomatin/prohibitin superfamily)
METIEQLLKEHATREMERLKVRLPVQVPGVLGMIAAVIWAIARLPAHGIWDAVVPPVGLGVVSVLFMMSVQMLAEWDRAVVLRLGRFRAIRGPGVFFVIPLFDDIVRIVDTRVRTTTFHSEAILTRDTVPVAIDAIAYWHVWDTRKAVLEVDSYYNAIVLAIQTALRDVVGVHSLAETLAEREAIAKRLQEVLHEKTMAWGISVTSIEMRDIQIPENLKEALSKQAQAERERYARTILGQAEQEIAEKFVEAARKYEDSPVALQLRAMNVIYEGLRSGTSMILVPSSTLDTMNLGGVIGLGGATGKLK